MSEFSVRPDWMAFCLPDISEAEVQADADVIRSGWWAMGPRTMEFQKKFAEYVGAKHCIAVNSCTAALHLALLTTVFFGVFWTGLSMACPNVYIRIFMAPTPEILDMAPAIIRTYALSFLLLPFNIFSTYYFQAIMKPRAAFIVSVARGLVISGILIMILPAVTGADSLWFAMPVTELAVMLYTAAAMGRYTKALHETAAARRA